MLTPDEMAFELNKMIYAKQTWLSDFSGGRNKRPDFELEQRRRELGCLTQARDAYASKKRKEAA